MSKGDCWRDLGRRTPDFWAGVFEGIRMFSVWKDGDQLVGIMRTPIKEVFAEIKEVIETEGLLGIDDKRRKAFIEALNYTVHVHGGQPMDYDDEFDHQVWALLHSLGLEPDKEK